MKPSRMKIAVIILAIIIVCAVSAIAVTAKLNADIRKKAVAESKQITTSASTVGGNTTTALVTAATTQKITTTLKTTEAKAHVLKKSELESLEKKFSNGGDYNTAFLTCTYDKPSEIDLDSVLYTGVGIDTEPTKEEQQTLIAHYGFTSGELENIHCSKITTAAANAYLLKKTGLKLNKFDKKLSWIYVKEYDAYFRTCSDCNYDDLAAINYGSVSADGVYTIGCSMWGTGDYEVSFRMKNGTIQFISNRVL